MKTFEFSVVTSGFDPQDEEFESRFYDAGCDDATISFQRGRTIVDFAREAETIEDAIISAVQAVRSIGGSVDRVEPDSLVSLSDIASRSNMTRAAISQYARGQRGRHFPAPVARVTSDSPLYDWGTVAWWLADNDKVTRDVMMVADAISHANRLLAADDPDFAGRLKQQVGRYEACPVA